MYIDLKIEVWLISKLASITKRIKFSHLNLNSAIAVGYSISYRVYWNLRFKPNKILLSETLANICFNNKGMFDGMNETIVKLLKTENIN